jgi:MFS family permease
MCLAHVASMTGFSIYTALLPQLQAEWAMSNTEAGLVSGVLLAGYMMAVPVLTALTDRVDARRIYMGATLVSACGAACFGLYAQGPWSAAAAQILLGIGVAGTYMPGLKSLTDNVGASHSRAVSFYTATFGIGMSLSLLLAGGIAEAFGWRVAFIAAAAGPLIAAAIMYCGFAPHEPERQDARTPLFDFRAVLANRRARRFIFGYAVHCWELFGSRAWLVAFLAFAQGSAHPATWAMGPVMIAAVANLFAPPASIIGNEIALRHGRSGVIRVAMAASGALTCLLGFLSGLPWLAIAALVMVQMWLVNSDSSALTAGLVGVAEPRMRGAAMAVHSTLGFGAGFAAPLVFGLVLDVSGGNGSASAWGFAFVSLGIAGVIAPLLLGFSRGERA